MDTVPWSHTVRRRYPPRYQDEIRSARTMLDCRDRNRGVSADLWKLMLTMLHRLVHPYAYRRWRNHRHRGTGVDRTRDRVMGKPH